MQPIEKFNANLGTAILLQGPAGGGKTCLGLSLFPKTYALIADLNFESGLRHLRDKKLPLPVGFDTVSMDENGKVVPVSQRYDRFWKCITAAAADPSVDCIFVDSATQVEDYVKAKICGAATEAAIKLSNFDQWGAYLITWKGIINQLRQTGKKIIFTAHEKKERDESDGIFKFQISLDGQIRDKFPALFSDVWRCELTEANNKYTYNVRTLGNVRHELKNTFSLPAIVSADELIKLVRAKCNLPS